MPVCTMDGPTIPCDIELRRMSNQDLDQLARSLQTPAEIEQLADALLRINRAWMEGAHSETSDTRRARRIRKEQEMPDEHRAQAPIRQEDIQQILFRASKAGLTELQACVWYMADVHGWTQQTIAKKLGCKQPAVSRALGRARQKLWEHIDTHSAWYRVFIREMRHGYFAPTKRPKLPPQLDAARQAFEAIDGISTHIVRFSYRKVEIWRDGKPVDTGAGYPNDVFGLKFGTVVKHAKKPQKVLAIM